MAPTASSLFMEVAHNCEHLEVYHNVALNIMYTKMLSNILSVYV